VTISSIKSAALSGALLSILAVPAGVQAQSVSGTDTGGIQLTFGVTFRLEAQDNRSLSPTNKQSSFEAATDLSFGLLTETRTQRFAFDLGGTLRALNTDLNLPNDSGFVEPFAALAYDISNASSRFSFSAQLRETDLSDSGTVLDDDGFEIISDGTATRRTSRADVSYDWGDDRRFGFGVFGRYLDTNYRGGVVQNTAGESLSDSTRLTYGARARFDINEATTLTSSLSHQTFEEDGTPGTRETIAFDNTLTIDRPLGPVRFDFGITNTEEGNRVALSAGRSFETPQGTWDGAVGVTRGVTGSTFLTANIGYNHPLPRGALTFGLARSVSSSNSEDTERLNTRLNLGYTQELTPISSISLSVNWSDTETTSTGLGTTSTTLGATYSHELTPDWNLNAGYRHNLRDDDTTGRASNNTIFLQMSRAFVTRF
jgi:hypothetical protein